MASSLLGLRNPDEDEGENEDGVEDEAEDVRRPIEGCLCYVCTARTSVVSKHLMYSFIAHHNNNSAEPLMYCAL